MCTAGAGPRRTSVFRRPFHAAALLALVLAANGCGDQSGSAKIAQIRIIHASLDAGGLDMYLNKTAVAYNLGFGTVTSYVPVEQGTYTFNATETGTSTVLSTTQAVLLANTQYTLLVGNVAAGLQSTLLQDQGGTAPSGQVSFRFLDQSTASGAVDIYLVSSSGTLLTSSPVLTNVAFNNEPGYVNVPNGTYSIVIVPAGTVLSADTVPTYSGSDVTYPSGSARTIVLLDQRLVTTPALQVVIANDFDSTLGT